MRYTQIKTIFYYFFYVVTKGETKKSKNSERPIEENKNVKMKIQST